MTAQRGSSLYADYIGDQITLEDMRKSSLEARGVTVITTSGALATLLFGVAALAKKSQRDFLLPTASHEWIKWALILFTSAAVFAILTNAPFRYQSASVDGLAKLLEESWNDTDVVAEKEVAENRITVLRNAKVWNGVKGWTLFFAVICEVTAVGCVTRAVWLAL